ncbi:unnamed protein product [Coregonus sp. 'balchen']|nr:unnamed protein product [Coregonus sp. 'balchen']
MGTGFITHRTGEIKLQVGSLHHETIILFVISSPREPLVLGHPWLVTHDPVISWKSGDITAWSEVCRAECLILPCKTSTVEDTKDGEPMGTGFITHRTGEIKLQVGSLHHETIILFVISSPREPLVLGHPWLVTHDPVISWKSGNITAWSEVCRAECLILPCKTSTVEDTKGAARCRDNPKLSHSEASQLFA